MSDRTDGEGEESGNLAGDPFEQLTDFEQSAYENLFEQEFSEADFEEIDTDQLWRELEESSSDQPAVRAIPDETESNVHIVPKHAYCESCQHYSQPPEVACMHEETEIIEFVDRSRVRVRNCPIVEERGTIALDDERSRTKHPGASQ